MSRLHHDQIGSIRLATDPSGGVIGTASYDPYGTKSSGSGTMPNIGWVGQYRDAEVGLVYLRARYYDPATAQFLTRDPLEASTREAYGYTSGNPLNATDPSGQNWLSDKVSGAASFVVEHLGALANITAGAVCIGTAGTGCLAAASLAAAVNAAQVAQNGGSVGDVVLTVFKSYALAVPGLAELGAEKAGAEGLAMMAKYGISTKGWGAPALLTYFNRLWYQGAVAIPDIREIYRALMRRSPELALALRC